MLRRSGAVDAGGWREEENDAMAGQNFLVGSHGEDEGGGKRKHMGGIRRFCGDFGLVESSTDCHAGVIRESENARFNVGNTV